VLLLGYREVGHRLVDCAQIIGGELVATRGALVHADLPLKLKRRLHLELLEIIEGGFVDVLLVDGALQYTCAVAYLEEDYAAAAPAVVEPAAYLDVFSVVLSAEYLGYVYETGHIDRIRCRGSAIIVFSPRFVIFAGVRG